MTQPSTHTVISQRKMNLMKYCLSSIILIISACAIAIIDPLERIIENQLEMRRGSFLFNVWENPPLVVYLKVYIFNVTNGDDFISGKDKKLKVQEIGPYIYQEFLTNHNATFHDNGTLSFVPHRRCVFLPELSVGDPHKDYIIAPNLALLAASTASAKISTFAAFGISTLVKTLKAKPLINITVNDFMWGYNDDLVRLANNLVPNIITFERLGILDRLFDEGHNIVSMMLPEGIKKLNREQMLQMTEEVVDKTTESITKLDASHTVISKTSKISDVEYDEDYENDKFNEIPLLSQTIKNTTENNAKNKSRVTRIREFSIDMWNGSPGLHHWGYDASNHSSNSPCTVLQGAYDGTLFPKRFSKDDKFYVYRKAFCRKLAIHYSHSAKLNGIEAFWFKLADNAFDDRIDDPETMCYCNKEKTCPKRGLGNITPCYYNLPIAVSLPHFYNSDPTLLKDVDGLHPEKEKHESIVAMQPRLGVPIKVTSRIQLNLMNGETKFNSNVKRFDHTVLPVLWIEAAVERLTPWLDFVLNMAFNILPIIQKIIIYIFAFIGCSGVALCSLKYFLFCDLPDDKKKSIKYTAVFPYIKREIAKFEEKEREMLQRIDATV